MRRAGLDYWDEVDLWVHAGWRDFREAIARERCLYFSANATRELGEARFRPNSCLVFGNETDGMPDRILEKHPDQCFRIPMPGQVRSLNLANAVSVVLYEGSAGSRRRSRGTSRAVATEGAGGVRTAASISAQDLLRRRTRPTLRRALASTCNSAFSTRRLTPRRRRSSASLYFRAYNQRPRMLER